MKICESSTKECKKARKSRQDLIAGVVENFHLWWCVGNQMGLWDLKKEFLERCLKPGLFSPELSRTAQISPTLSLCALSFLLELWTLLWNSLLMTALFGRCCRSPPPQTLLLPVLQFIFTAICRQLLKIQSCSQPCVFCLFPPLNTCGSADAAEAE